MYDPTDPVLSWLVEQLRSAEHNYTIARARDARLRTKASMDSMWRAHGHLEAVRDVHSAYVAKYNIGNPVQEVQ